MLGRCGKKNCALAWRKKKLRRRRRRCWNGRSLFEVDEKNEINACDEKEGWTMKVPRLSWVFRQIRWLVFSFRVFCFLFCFSSKRKNLSFKFLLFFQEAKRRRKIKKNLSHFLKSEFVSCLNWERPRFAWDGVRMLGGTRTWDDSSFQARWRFLVQSFSASGGEGFEA